MPSVPTPDACLIDRVRHRTGIFHWFSREGTNKPARKVSATENGGRNFHILDCRGGYDRQESTLKTSLGKCRLSFDVRLDET